MTSTVYRVRFPALLERRLIDYMARAKLDDPQCLQNVSEAIRELVESGIEHYFGDIGEEEPYKTARRLKYIEQWCIATGRKNE